MAIATRRVSSKRDVGSSSGSGSGSKTGQKDAVHGYIGVADATSISVC